MWTIVHFVDITVISVSRQMIILLSGTAYKCFDPPTHQKIHFYIYDLIAFWSSLQIFSSAYTSIITFIHTTYFIIISNFILYLYFSIQPPTKKMLRMFWNAYTFQNIFEIKNCILFTWNQLKDILLSRLIQANIWF